MAWLNYHHLLYFRTIANEGGIAKAARKLRLGQPTLSTQLKQFEHVIGKELFERKNRSLVLTEAGKVVLDYANQIFGLGDELLSVLKDEAFSDRIQVRVGVLDSVPKSCVVKLAEEALRQFRCTLALTEGRSDELFRDLFAHELDLVMTNHTPGFDEMRRAYTKTIARYRVSVFGAPGFRSLARDFPESLAGQPFVVPTFHSKLRHDIDHFFKARGIDPVVVVETQDTAVQKLLCAGGTGLAALPDLVGTELVEEGKLVRLGELDGVLEEIWLVAGARKIENPVASKLMKAFRLEGHVESAPSGRASL